MNDKNLLLANGFITKEKYRIKKINWVQTEMIRILTEQGVDEASAYVGTQQPSILKAVGDIAKTAHERIRTNMWVSYWIFAFNSYNCISYDIS